MTSSGLEATEAPYAFVTISQAVNGQAKLGEGGIVGNGFPGTGDFPGNGRFSRESLVLREAIVLNTNDTYSSTFVNMLQLDHDARCDHDALVLIHPDLSSFNNPTGRPTQP